MEIDAKLSLVLSSDKVDLQTLLEIARLDPSADLKGCDFSNVDFGTLEAEEIDLSFCNLSGADLRNVRGRLNIQGATCAGAKLPINNVIGMSESQKRFRLKRDLLKQVALSAHRFYLPSRVAKDIVAHIDQKRPLVTCYRSHTEHAIVAQSIQSSLIGTCNERVDDLYRKRARDSRIRLIEISSALTPARLPLDHGNDLDDAFLRSLQSSETRLLFDTSVTTDYVSSVIDHIKRNSYYDRLSFQRLSAYSNSIDSLHIGLSHFVKLIADRTSPGITIFFMNGVSPFSNNTWTQIQRASHNLRFVWLVPSNMLYRDISANVKQNLLPSFVVIKPTDLVTKSDASDFIARIENYKKSGLIVSEECRNTILSHVGKSVADMKNVFLSRLMRIAANVSKSEDQIIL